MRIGVTILGLALFSTAAMAGELKVHVQDPTGPPVADVLVIVQPLEGHRFDREQRQLTGPSGDTASFHLPAGFYRIIATTPYGLWKTVVQEISIGESPRDLVLIMFPMPTHGFGDMIQIPPPEKMKLTLLRANGSPAAGASVFVRDAEDNLVSEAGYIANDQGKVTVDLNGYEHTTVIVTLNGNLYSTEINKAHEPTIKLPF